jgi:hypothetical protein
MNRNKAILLALIQIALVLSIAGKYLYERKTCPRVWVRTAQFDPNMPLRGRYLALQLSVDACDKSLQGQMHRRTPVRPRVDPDRISVPVRSTVRAGKLVVVAASDRGRPEMTQYLWFSPGESCDRAVLSESVEYFIADTARSPFPLQPGQELWVEVTVPPMGPPRPIQLATSKDGVFTPLKLD